MSTQSTLLCIHRDPDQLLHLEEKGYRLVTATCGHEGLRLLMSHQVDAVVIEFHLGLLDGAVVASEIKRVKPKLPIVMVCDNVELPDDALKAVDAIAIKSDGQHFLVATIHFVLSVEWEQQHTARMSPAGRPFNRLGGSRGTTTKRSSPHTRTRRRNFHLEGVETHS